MDPNTEAIIRMAWARTLAVPDDSFSGAAERLDVPSDDATQVLAVLLGDQCVLSAPTWAIDEAASYSDEALVSTQGLLRLTRDHAPSRVRSCRLMYADEYVEDPALESAIVTDDPAALDDLLRRCAPDDVGQTDLRSRSHLFVLLEDETDRPLAAAAYDDEGGMLADLSVIEAIDARGSGVGALVGAIATNDALDEGLIPQLMIDRDVSTESADALGYVELGQLARVQVR
ncbi:hypothetical protein EK0264_14500 [Epidermidibacterium keratini]|uniref:Uncharacterized protein n=1 Tax=Epidermidibacterium keratini TaxID=1891644 RepID=A0A7L4YS48_9ACTN|nr:hypothetical protein [Epidermidibacterium keratini]QHC01377.1 hypothetical protein EK0264_14500 [Epidermidibacterium keratini]